MKKLNLVAVLFCLILTSGWAQTTKNDEALIRQVLNRQVIAWNEANIDEFMKGYWKSDSILFIGRKITSGWDSTILRYKKSYPDKAAMGKLRSKF